MNRRFGVKTVLAIFLVLSLSLCFFACANDDSGDKKGVTVIGNDNTATKPLYTVTFNDNGDINTVRVTAGEKISKPATPVKNGYTFNGWFKDSVGSEEWNFLLGVSGNMTLYAKWTLTDKIFVDSENFSYNSQSGARYIVANNESSVDLTEQLFLQRINGRYAFFIDEQCLIPACERDEAIFELDYGINEYYIKIMDSSLSEETAEIIKFTFVRKQLFTVNYYDTSKNLIESVNIIEGDKILNPCEYSLIGYDIGWYDSNGNEWVFGNSGKEIKENVNLYAVSFVKNYKVTFDLNGGTTDVSEVTVTYGQNYFLPIPTKSGNNFIGWYTLNGECITERNAVPLSLWDIPEDTTLIAKWEAVYYTFSIKTSVRKLNYNSSADVYESEEVVTTVSKSVSYGMTQSLQSSEYDFINGELYVFQGWYDKNGAKLSTERVFVTEEITRNTEVTERWFIYYVKFDSEKASVSISGNANYKKYESINENDTFEIELNQKEGNTYTFCGWNNGSTSKRLTLTAYAQTIPLISSWDEYRINMDYVLIDNEIYTGNELSDLVSGVGAKIAGTNVVLCVKNSETYTFAGWYDSEDNLITNEFLCDLGIMPAKNLTVKGKWYTTSVLINIENSPEGMVSILAEENICGKLVHFIPRVNTGYMLKSIKNNGNAVADYKDIIPTTPQTYVPEYVRTPLEVNATSNFGKITYKINGGIEMHGTTNGGSVRFCGTRYGDTVKLTSSSYNGYVWLGWYDEEMSLISEKSEYALILGEDTSTVNAVWRPIVRDIKINAEIYYLGLSAGATTGAVVSGRYYENSNGIYSLTSDLTYDDNKEYYVRKEITDTASMGAEGKNLAGTPKVTAVLTGANRNGIILSTTVNAGFRFDGWYTKSGEWISYDMEYLLSSVDDAKYYANNNVGDYGYVARFTELNASKYPTVYIFRHALATTDAIIPGETFYYAFYEGKPGNCTEYCRLTVSTKVSPFDNNEYKGFNFSGLYELSSSLEIENLQTNDQVRSLCAEYRHNVTEGDVKESEMASENFSLVYKLKVTGRQKSLGQVRIVALWDYNTGSQLPWYYKRSNLTNSDLNAGDIYYCGDNSGDIQKLILYAEPRTGYLFDSWINDDNNGTEIASTSPLLIVESDIASPSYKAKWRSVNTGREDSNKYNIVTGDIIGGTYEVKGNHSLLVEGNTTTENTEIVFKTITYNGYEFLGWYDIEGNLITVDAEFTITDYISITEEISYGEKVVTIEENCTLISKNSNYMEWDKKIVVFCPIWKEMTANITLDTGIDGEILGNPIITSYYLPGNKRMYHIDIESDSYFENNGLAWHGGYEFKGWYGENGQKVADKYITGKYALDIPEDEIQDFYRAVWEKSEYEVTLNLLPTGSTGDSNAYYDFRTGTDGNKRIVLQAVAAPGYRFSAWKLPSGEELSTTSYYEFPIMTNEKSFRFTANFVKINNVNIEVIADYISESNIDTEKIGAPYITGFGASGYLLAAEPKNGLLFNGWWIDDELQSTYLNYEFSVPVDQIENKTVVARYSPITHKYQDFSIFIARDLGQYELFSRYVSYYVGLDSDGTEKLFINVNVPNGYGYYIKKSNEIVQYSSDNKYKFAGYTDINSRYYIEFYRVSEFLNNYVALNNQTAGTIFEVTGYLNVIESLNQKKFYKEKWSLNADFYSDTKDGNEYKFIGWYNEDVLIENEEEIINEIFESTKKKYEIDAKNTNDVYKAYFGTYVINIENEDEEFANKAGELTVKDYDVTITFNPNTDKDVGGIAFQQLNTRSQIRYPNEYTSSISVKNAGLIFAGWYDNTECQGEPFDFTQPISSDLMLYAKWIDVSQFGSAIPYDAETTLQTSLQGKRFYFHSLANGHFTLDSKITNIGKTAEIIISEVEFYYEDGQILKRVLNEIERMQVDAIGFGEVITVLETEQGHSYEIFVKANTANDFDTVTLSLKGCIPKAGGSRDNIVPYAGEFTVTATEKLGYSFAGWYCNGNPIGRSRKYRDSGDETSIYYVYEKTITIDYTDYEKYAIGNKITLIAKWEKYEITVVNAIKEAGSLDYSLITINTGTNVGAKAWNLKPLTISENYVFSGWYFYNENNEYVLLSMDPVYNYILRDSDKDIIIKGSWKYNGIGGELKQIIYNMNAKDSINSPLNQDTFDSNGSSLITLYSPTWEVITDTDTYHYIFEGWYTDDTYETKIENINPQNYKTVGSVTVYAKWGSPVSKPEVVEENGIEYIYIGEYPQSLADESLYQEILNNGTIDKNGFYVYKNVKYEKVNITSKITYNGKEYEPGEYWFIVEKLKWKVIRTNGTQVTVEAAFNIDAIQYNLVTMESNIDNKVIYANNWEYSNLRNWINDAFINKYFTEWDKNLLMLTLSSISNDASVGDIELNDSRYYPWVEQNDTKDIGYVMSFTEKTDFTLGYNSSYSSNDEARMGECTAYAAFKGLNTVSKDGKTYSAYWMRSPATSGYYVYGVDENGKIVKYKVTDKLGVRPVFTIDLNK